MLWYNLQMLFILHILLSVSWEEPCNLVDVSSCISERLKRPMPRQSEKNHHKLICQITAGAHGHILTYKFLLVRLVTLPWPWFIDFASSALIKRGMGPPASTASLCIKVYWEESCGGSAGDDLVIKLVTGVWLRVWSLQGHSFTSLLSSAIAATTWSEKRQKRLQIYGKAASTKIR